MLDDYKVSFSPEARQELRELERYLGGRFGQSGARRYARRVIAACNKLGVLPLIGKSRSELSPGLRQIGFEKRITIYFFCLQSTKRVVIASILYGGREADEDALSDFDL